MPLDLSTFDFEEQAVRVIMRDGAPWFVAADVCRVLDHSNPTMAVAGLDDDEKDVVSTNTVDFTDGIRGMTLSENEGHRGGARSLTIISESGLYALVMRSNKPAARRFRKWITSEVIPAIRRTGRYEAPLGREPDPFADLDDLTARTQIAWLQMVREARILGGANAGKRLWAKSPLPRWDDDGGEIVSHDPMLVRFLREACEVTGQRADSLRSSDLFTAYQAWCARIGYPGAAPRGFQLQLHALSRVYRAPGTGAMFTRGKASVMMYFGIRWRMAPDPAVAA